MILLLICLLLVVKIVTKTTPQQLLHLFRIEMPQQFIIVIRNKPIPEIPNVPYN